MYFWQNYVKKEKERTKSLHPGGKQNLERRKHVVLARKYTRIIRVLLSLTSCHEASTRGYRSETAGLFDLGGVYSLSKTDQFYGR